MRAIGFDHFGDPAVLALIEAPVPQLRAGDLLVRVAAAGINRADLNQRRGIYGHDYFGDSSLMGLEIAGQVTAVAPDVADFAPGDRVMGIVGGGGYAEFARIPASMAIHVPRSIDLVTAAAIPEAFVTAHEALFHLGRLAARETVLIHGAGGGVGTAMLTLAAAFGARVIATGRGEIVPKLLDHGASIALDYREDFLPRVREVTDDRGVDLVICAVGTPNFERNILALADGGRLVQLGLMKGRSPAPLSLEALLFKRLTLMGSVMKSRTLEEKAAMSRRFADRWMSAISENRIMPIVARTYPLADARIAHAAMEAGGSFGKLLLTL